MVSNLIVRDTTDENEIKYVLNHPSIKDRISDSDDDYELPDDYRYIVGEVDGQLIGLVVLHPFRDGLEAHHQVIAGYRKEYAKEFANRVIEQLPNTIIYGIVPTLYKNVIEFDKSIGFKHVETFVCNFEKNGICYDEYLMKLNTGE